MGHTVNSQCRACGNTFTVDHGGGFYFHLLRCDKCGNTKSISFNQLGDLHLRFLKGLRVPYSVASAEHDKNIREHADVEPISQEAYYKGVETIAGNCQCRGSYRFDAPPRCPNCNSTEIEEGEITVMYD
jgi:predicted Zn-ribbon and HTH transcriptional regulator